LHKISNKYWIDPLADSGGKAISGHALSSYAIEKFHKANLSSQCLSKVSTSFNWLGVDSKLYQCYWDFCLG